MSLKSDRQRAIALLTASALASNRARQVLITLSGHKDFSIHIPDPALNKSDPVSVASLLHAVAPVNFTPGESNHAAL